MPQDSTCSTRYPAPAVAQLVSTEVSVTNVLTMNALTRMARRRLVRYVTGTPGCGWTGCACGDGNARPSSRRGPECVQRTVRGQCSLGVQPRLQADGRLVGGGGRCVSDLP